MSRRVPQTGRAASRWTKPALLVGAVLLAAVIFVVWSRLGSSNETPADAVPCGSTEMTALHEHAHLAIVIRGHTALIPANVGIRPTCISWLHTHDTSGVVHIEAGTSGTYTLGQFFAVWGQPLSTTHLLGETVQPGESLRVIVDGAAYSGDPRAIALTQHRQITLDLGPPFPEPTPFTFPAGL